MDNLKTQDLVALAQKGDGVALNQLCSVYGERVRRIIRLRLDRKLRPKLDSVDIVQDALILALGRLKDFTYKNEGDFLRWLCRIAENRLYDIFDKFHTDKRNIRKEIPFKKEDRHTEGDVIGALDPAWTTTPSAILCRKESLDKLEKALDKLKPEYKEVVVLKMLEGLSHAEIAEKLGKKEAAARTMLARALAALTIAYRED